MTLAFSISHCRLSTFILAPLTLLENMFISQNFNFLFYYFCIYIFYIFLFLGRIYRPITTSLCAWQHARIYIVSSEKCPNTVYKWRLGQSTYYLMNLLFVLIHILLSKKCLLTLGCAAVQLFLDWGHLIRVCHFGLI